MSHAKNAKNAKREENSSGEGMEKPLQAFSFAFFAALREKNLLSKFAPNAEVHLQFGTEIAEMRRRGLFGESAVI